MLKETFLELLTNYAVDDYLKNELWIEIMIHYSEQDRCYHTLEHLENILMQLLEVKNDIQDWDIVLFSLYYHDIIYSITKSDNEEKSAQLAELRLKQISVSTDKIERCKQCILATQNHNQSIDNDINYFIDADLSILGQDWDVYSSYYGRIRKEYSLYPDSLYHTGRKKVLMHFLAMDRIFKTDFFYNKYEKQAKKNLLKELARLNS